MDILEEIQYLNLSELNQVKEEIEKRIALLKEEARLVALLSDAK